MKMLRYVKSSRLFSAVSVLPVLLMLSFTVNAADVRYLWQSREQFVALEPQEKPKTGSEQPNAHPAGLTLERLASILESIEMRNAQGSRPEALFTKASVQMLAPQLLQGLQQASPAEDVTFAIIGLHDALFGLAKSPKVTTGRVFYKAGRLNIIVGLVHQEVRDRDDRRLVPFTPGSRNEVATGDWTLLPQQDRKGFGQIRKDWLTFSDEWQTATAQPPVIEQRLPPVQGAHPLPAKQNSETRSPAERLSTLKELKDKGLISEDEYRGKRMEILNGL